MIAKSGMPIMECVPNFSEGRDAQKIQVIAQAIQSVEGAHLLHTDTSPAANRTVMTFAGEPAAVVEAAYRGIAKAAEVIDMRQQAGVHPRIGATDVCPLVPLYNISMEDAIVCASKLGERIGNQLNIPIYLYEHSAQAEHRRALPHIRKGQYEGFAEKIAEPNWKPDFGPVKFTPASGATVLGARDILVAFNISINTTDVEKAEYIAKRIRTSGYIKDEGGKRERINGLLQKVRAIGWYTADFNCAQVSMNLLDYKVASPLKVWETCEMLAKEIGVELMGSELIGLMPEECLLQAGSYCYLKEGEEAPDDKEVLVHKGIEYLKLNRIKPFDQKEKILEYALQAAGLL